VTNRRFALYLRMSGAADLPDGWHQGTHPPGEEELPVTGVTVAQAQAYARSVGGRLPAALEWERAAGWDPTARKKRLFPWGDDLRSDACNFAGYAAGRGKAMPVRSLPADRSAYGVYDLAGNVGEWVLGPHPLGAAGAEGDVALVMGGAFATADLRLARSTFFAGPFAADLRSPAIGFRIVYDKLPQ